MSFVRTYLRVLELLGSEGRLAATLALATIVCNQGKQPTSAKVTWKVLDARGATVATAESPEQSIPVDGSAPCTATATLASPALWSVDEPNLYSAIVTVESDGQPRDAERVSFGIRTALFDPEKGFFLNGKSLKIQGTCNHQDHAGVGAALSVLVSTTYTSAATAPVISTRLIPPGTDPTSSASTGASGCWPRSAPDRARLTSARCETSTRR